MGGQGQIWVCPLKSWDSIICCISRMNEWNELIFCMLIHGIRKAKSYFGYADGQRYDCDLLGPGTLKSALSQLKNKSMNWADFLHVGSDGIIFDLTINHASYLWLLNTGAPL